MVPTNVKIITKVNNISLVKSIMSVYYNASITSFALISIEAVIIIRVIVLIFFWVSRILQIFLVCYLRNGKPLIIYCVLWSYMHSKELRENGNRIIRITGLTFFKNIRHVGEPVSISWVHDVRCADIGYSLLDHLNRKHAYEGHRHDIQWLLPIYITRSSSYFTSKPIFTYFRDVSNSIKFFLA